MSANVRLNTPSIPPVTKHLIIINAILWFASMLLGSRGIVDLTNYLGLHFWKGSDFHIHQLFTYMFMHDTSSWSTGSMHILFNMFTLWMFGSLLERVMGMKRYLFFYLVCGVGAGLVQELVWQFSWQGLAIDNLVMQGVSVQQATFSVKNGLIPNIGDFYNMLVTVGASGAVFGVLLAFAMMFPNAKLFIMLIPIPVKAKYAVIGFVLFELFFGVSGIMDNVAHFAHLGGMLFALILILYWKKTGAFNNYYDGI